MAVVGGFGRAGIRKTSGGSAFIIQARLEPATRSFTSWMPGLAGFRLTAILLVPCFFCPMKCQGLSHVWMSTVRVGAKVPRVPGLLLDRHRSRHRARTRRDLVLPDPLGNPGLALDIRAVPDHLHESWRVRVVSAVDDVTKRDPLRHAVGELVDVGVVVHHDTLAVDSVVSN